jgi:endonuclease/exonuclease/phosphatase family metal-dependent hydrolase
VVEPANDCLLVASHNIMDGRRLAGLIRDYRALRARRGLDLLCIQENAGAGADSHAARIAAGLGRDYGWVWDPRAPRLALVLNRRRLRCAGWRLVALPRLERLSWIERRYIAGGRTRPKQALLAHLDTPTGRGLLVADFHLESAGSNAHRQRQAAAIAAALAAGPAGYVLVAAGDSNAFALDRRGQLDALATVLAPLAALGLRAPGFRPTHFFARQHEPKLWHRLCVQLGRLGLDLPRRYDVVCSDRPLAGWGQLTTPDSDHDLVWSRLRLE